MTLRTDQTDGLATSGNHAADHVATNVQVNANTAAITTLSGKVLPTGGTPGQVLTKNTGANYDVAWAAGGTSTGSPSTAPVYVRGVNVSGAEFGSDAAHLPGTYDADYHYDSLASFNYLASRKHLVVRLPFRWERIQPTRNAALNSAELTRLTAAVANIQAAGMTAILDVHNFARYIQSGGSTLTIGNDLPTADLIDLWTRLSTAFKGNTGIYAYGLMNEPHDINSISGAYTPNSTVFDFNTTIQSWVAETTQTLTSSATQSHDGGQSLKVADAAPTNSTGYLIRVNDGAHNTLVQSNGSTISAWVLVPTGTLGSNWRAHVEMQNGSFSWQAGPDTVLTPGTWAQITYTPSTTIWTGHKGIGIQFSVDSPTTAPLAVYVDTFQQGTKTVDTTGAQVWEGVSQNLVDAIRGNGDTTKILVPGYAYSGAQNWATNHPAPWITDSGSNFAYEGHYYFDTGNSGAYNDTYATTNTAAVSAGYASLTARASAEMAVWLNWLNTNHVPGFMGEIGWRNDESTASWNAVGEAVYDLLDASNVSVTYWSAGEWWGTGYILSAYTGTPQATTTSIATIIEAHQTLYAQASDATLSMSDITNNNASTARHGFVPKLSGDATTFFNGVGNFSQPFGGSPVPGGGTTGQMLAKTSSSDGAVAWINGPIDGVTGSPGILNRGVYNNATTYGANDGVTYLGSYFLATAGTTGVVPGTYDSPGTNWQGVARGNAPRTVTTASSSTPTPNADITDVYTITAQAANATFGAPTGTPVNGQKLTIRIKDNGTARTTAWNAIYIASGTVALLTTTVINKTHRVSFEYDSTAVKWVASSTDATGY